MLELAPIETTNDDAMDDERRSETPGRRDSDQSKPSPWNDPRLWVGVCALLLTIVMGLLTFIASQLDSMKSDVKDTNAYVKATNDAVLIVTTKQAADNKSIEERVSKLENAQTVQQQAYNFNFTTRLAVVEAKTGVKHQQE